MNYLSSNVNTNANQVVKVILEGNAANVMVLDSINFTNYKNRRQFRYYGGHYTHSPVIIKPPHAGNWYVVIDLGGGPGKVKASVSVI